MDGNKLYNKISDKFSRLFSIFIRKSFKEFGRGTLIHFPNRIENAGNIRLGRKVIIYKDCWIMAVDKWHDRYYGGQIIIKDKAVICHGVQISAARCIEIGKNTGIGENSVVVDHLHDYTYLGHPILLAPLTDPKPVEIQNDVFIGVNCIIGPGSHIGEHAFIGANSVVSGIIPSYSYATGNPARVIRRYNAQSGLWERVEE